MTESIYERVGGEPAIMAAVGLLYQKLMDDDVTRPFFDGMDMDALVRKQVAFMTWAFQGPAEHRGRDLRTAHAHLVAQRGLSDVHFDAVASHLAASLRELEVEQSLIDEILGVIGLTRTEVLDR